MDFSGYQYPSDIILQAVRYYVSYKLSTRDIEDIFTERGSAIDHSTVNRWVITFAPILEQNARQLKEYANGNVTFSYLDHNSKKHKELSLTQTEMMLRVLSHVPEKYFKIVRYFGFLSTRLRGDMLPMIYDKLGV